MTQYGTIEKAPGELGLFLWWIFTTKFEPILNEIANQMQTSPPRVRQAPAAPRQKTLCLFFGNSPAEIFWIWKRVFVVVRCRFGDIGRYFTIASMSNFVWLGEIY